MTAPTSTSAPAGSLGELRGARRALRAERAAVIRWRRLVRARLDLALAATVPVEPLGMLAAEHLPEGAGVEVPMHGELAAALLVDAPTHEVAQLGQLRDLDQRLRRYELALDDALRSATDAFVADLATDPRMCLDVLAHGLPGAGAGGADAAPGGPDTPNDVGRATVAP